MTEQEVNVPLLRKYVEWVEEQEQLRIIDREWDQETWMTSPECRALELLHDPVREVSLPEYELLIEHCGTAYCLAGKIASDHDQRYATRTVVAGVHCSDLAQEILGISEGKTLNLWRGENTAADIRRIAEELAGEPL